MTFEDAVLKATEDVDRVIPYVGYDGLSGIEAFFSEGDWSATEICSTTYIFLRRGSRDDVIGLYIMGARAVAKRQSKLLKTLSDDTGRVPLSGLLLAALLDDGGEPHTEDFYAWKSCLESGLTVDIDKLLTEED